MRVEILWIPAFAGMIKVTDGQQAPTIHYISRADIRSTHNIDC